MTKLSFYAGENAIMYARAFVAGEWVESSAAANAAIMAWLASQNGSPLGPPQVVRVDAGAVAEIAVMGTDVSAAESFAKAAQSAEIAERAGREAAGTQPPPAPVEAITVEAPKADA